MKIYSRILVLAASLLMIGGFFLPVWQIDLSAPQYPEGLGMKIWIDKLSGDIDIINGLNHYIGMKHIKAEMFPEFSYMKYILGALIGIGLLVTALGKKPVLYTWFALTRHFSCGRHVRLLAAGNTTTAITSIRARPSSCRA